MTTARYWDKEGSPIPDVVTWAWLLDKPGYKGIVETTLADGTWISTVWLGLDQRFNHRFNNSPPLIFETMVFLSQDGLDSQDMNRYSNLEEAEEGHQQMVAKWSK